MKNTLEPDIAAGLRALDTGDKAATRAYCGAYVLVRAKNGRLYRTTKPSATDAVVTDSTDTDGFLLAKYWALPRR